MGLKSSKILGISVTTESRENILEYIEKYLEKSSVVSRQSSAEQKKPLVVATPNPEQIVLAQNDKHFFDILNQADVAIPDGVGILLAAKFLGDKRQATGDKIAIARIPGVEFMEDLVQMAATKSYRIGLIGGRGGVAVRALECLSRRAGLRGWTFEPGEIDLSNLGDLGDLCEKIQKTNTKIVFVGLGAPKQEFFITRLARLLSFRPTSRNPEEKGWIPGQARDDTEGLVLMSVGGAFDMIAGRVKRAPWIVRGMGLEWLWRLLHEPWRWRRQLALLKFFWMVIREKLVSRGPALRN